MDIRDQLEELLRNKKYNEMIMAIDEYIKNGYGVDEKIIYLYIRALALLQRYDEVYIFAKNFEKINHTMRPENLADMYLCCFKSKEAERVLSNNTFPLKDELLPVKIALRQGKIEEARKLLGEVEKKHHDNEKTIKAIEKYRKIIDFHLRYGAFIEIEYESFIENGNTLEPGHIIFLKHSSAVEGEENENDKSAMRPYMIWKIENDEIYMFPVSAKISNGGYRLFCQNYPNSVGDRVIINSLAKTTIDNVLSVKDKVTDFDFEALKRNLFKRTYYNKSKLENNKKFMNAYTGIPNVHNIIFFKDYETKRIKKYFILGETDEEYIVIACNNEETKITGIKTEIISKKQQIYYITKIEKDTINEFLSQIDALKELKTLKGKIVSLEEGTYVIIDEEEDTLKAVETGYSPSWIKPVLLEKNKIKEIIDEVDEDEINRIIKIIEEYYRVDSEKIYKRIKSTR